MSSMFPPIEEDIDMKNSYNAASAVASAPGVSSRTITEEDLHAFMFYSQMMHKGRKKLKDINTMEQVVQLIEQSSNILVLTGAGISVSAGIPDFRSKDGLYATLKDKFNLSEPTTMFDMNYFLKDPSLFFSFGGDICPGFDDTRIKFYPTPTHHFIKLLERKGKLLRNYTQNIDTLEMRAGIDKVITCHGSYITASCINCQFQVRGNVIESHIFDKQIPLCPYCVPARSDLSKRDDTDDDTDNTLNGHKQIVTWNASRTMLLVRLPNRLVSLPFLQTGCPILFSFSKDVLQKAVLNADDMAEAAHAGGAMNFKTLVMKSGDAGVLQVCHDAIMQWLRTEIKSFGVMKPDIVFFNESLSFEYHNTLEKDIAQCDLLLIMGTSLQVQPVSSIPNKVPAHIPAVLVNREVVGYPNEFDVNLLGNCDDVVTHLCRSLDWQMTHSDEQHHEMKTNSTVSDLVEPSVPNRVMPNFYVFDNGTLPDYLKANT